VNKRLEQEPGERVAEKRGWHWALLVLLLRLGERWCSRMKGTTLRATPDRNTKSKITYCLTVLMKKYSEGNGNV
jgi:hypothetical protein